MTAVAQIAVLGILLKNNNRVRSIPSVTGKTRRGIENNIKRPLKGYFPIPEASKVKMNGMVRTNVNCHRSRNNDIPPAINRMVVSPASAKFGIARLASTRYKPSKPFTSPYQALRSQRTFFHGGVGIKASCQ